MMTMCLCGTLPTLVDADNASEGFMRTLVKIDAKNWLELFSCSGCGQLWSIEIPDKYQARYAFKVQSNDCWADINITDQVKQLIVASHSGLSEAPCVWSACPNYAVKGFALCADHLFEMGVRK